MVAIGLLRIILEVPLNKTYTIAYFIIFILGVMVSEEFLAISVDASGANYWCYDNSLYTSPWFRGF